MADELTYFSWVVPKAGYKWVRAKPSFLDDESEDWFLTDGIPSNTPRMLRRYAPLMLYTGLFRTFTDIQPNKKGILEFANAYGRLGGKLSESIPVTAEEGSGRKILGAGERIGSWVQEISDMRRLVGLWDAAGGPKPDLPALSRVIRWREKDHVLYASGPVEGITPPGSHISAITETIAAEGIHAELMEWCQPGDLVTPAKYLIQRHVNGKLDEHGVLGRLLWDTRHSGMAVHIVPQSLVGCLWLQFAKAIEGDKEYRQCDNCRLWFEVGGSRAARSDKRFCSPTCKAAAHRKKQAEARDLYTRGAKVGELARRLKTDVSTVKGWVMK